MRAKNGSVNKECHKSLQPDLKYRVQDSSRSPNELTHEPTLVVKKMGVAIVCVCVENKEQKRDWRKLILKGAWSWIEVLCVPMNTTNPNYKWLSRKPRSHTLSRGRVGGINLVLFNPGLNPSLSLGIVTPRLSGSQTRGQVPLAQQPMHRRIQEEGVQHEGTPYRNGVDPSKGTDHSRVEEMSRENNGSPDHHLMLRRSSIRLKRTHNPGTRFRQWLSFGYLVPEPSILRLELMKMVESLLCLQLFSPNMGRIGLEKWLGLGPET
ncbi:hypothetical protein PIB30_029897 [Stylosanthes scabra]|uniref:Uncharacterized protein n=1 Tax=Stylosanthes scabra TaxID=79078 RepID=A0ABU6RBV9_9FABA|nr:hypothetical protein [Stylosanthes scabra]